jgi:hypothetical protein
MEGGGFRVPNRPNSRILGFVRVVGKCQFYQRQKLVLPERIGVNDIGSPQPLRHASERSPGKVSGIQESSSFGSSRSPHARVAL